MRGERVTAEFRGATDAVWQELDAARARIVTLEAALRPFADAAKADAKDEEAPEQHLRPWAANATEWPDYAAALAALDATP